MKDAKIMLLLSMVTSWLHLFVTPFSFVKLFLKKMIKGFYLYKKNIESAPGKPFLKSTTPQSPPPSPPPSTLTSLQKRWIGPRTLKTAPRALDIVTVSRITR